MPATASPIVFEAYGVTVEAPEVALPPGWRPGDPERVSARFALSATGEVLEDGAPVTPPAPADVAAERAEALVRGHIALHAPEHTFVHAGVVVHDGRAIVIPGASFSGKTTLVAALVAAGAAYASDEFAVLDGDGLVHPFAKPLSLRPAGSMRQTDVPASSLGATATDPAPVGMIVVTGYVAGAGWLPRRGDAATGALALLGNAVAARRRPAQTLAAARAAAAGAEFVIGRRGEASLAAAALLEVPCAA